MGPVMCARECKRNIHKRRRQQEKPSGGGVITSSVLDVFTLSISMQHVQWPQLFWIAGRLGKGRTCRARFESTQEATLP